MFYQCKMGQNTLEDVVDKFNIRELIEFERYCRDYKLWDEMRPLYHDDAKIVVSWMTGTPDEFVAGSKRMNASKAPAKHKVFDTVIWKNGNRAVAECITAIQIRCPMGDDTVDMSRIRACTITSKSATAYGKFSPWPPFTKRTACTPCIRTARSTPARKSWISTVPPMPT